MTIPDNLERGFPRSVASFSAANTAPEVEMLTFCLRRTWSAAAVPQGGIPPQQHRPGAAAAQNLQTARKLLSLMDALIEDMTDTPINHLDIHTLIHN